MKSEKIKQGFILQAGIFLLVCMLPMVHVAQTKPMHISALHSVSTDGIASKEKDYHFSFNLFTGIVRDIKGLEIGTLFNENLGSMQGTQLSGLVNRTANRVNGIQIAGITNMSGDMTGIQLGGINNHSQSTQGLQIAGIINTANDVRGIQIGGIFNRATTLKGVQLGLVNIADDAEKGIGIGLINIYKNGGYREIELSANDYLFTSLSLRTGNKKLYSIISLGYQFYTKKYLAGGFGIGSLWTVRPSLYIKPEFLMYNYVSTDLKFTNTINTYHVRLGLMQKMNKIGISFYPGIYYNPTRENVIQKLGWFEPFRKGTKGNWNFGLGLGINFMI